MGFLNGSRLIFLGVLFLVILNVSAALKTPTVEHEWKGLMRTLPDDRFATYTQALDLLNSLQNSPSCNRLAASTLLESCQKVDDAPPSTEESLEDIKSTYAARLALCEISATGLAAPSDCKPLLPADDGEGKLGLKWIKGSGKAKSAVFKDVGSRQLSLCLRSLESRPQWWTSYSNSRQNAVIMCQAARVDIDRDNLIKLYKSMALATSTMKDALSKALENATTKLSQQEESAVKVKGFQQRVFKDLDSLTLHLQSSLAKSKENVETVMQSMLGKWKTMTSHFGLELDELQNTVRNSNKEAVNLGENFQQLRQRSSELLASQIKQRDSIRKFTAEFQVNLRAVGDLQSQLHASVESTSLIDLKQQIIDERLENLANSFTDLESKTETFHTAQNSQVAMQNLLHEQVHQMRTEIQTARQMVMEITSSASAVQVVLEKSSSQLTKLATLASLASTILQLCWALLGIAALYRFSSTLAGYTVAALGFILLIKSSGLPIVLEKIPRDTVLIHYASGYQVPFLPVVQVAVFIILMIAIVLLRHQFHRRSPQVQKI